MFNSEILKTEFSNLLGWRQHHDTDEVEIATPLTLSSSGEYFQQKHPAMDLAVIKTTLPASKDLDEYLQQKVDDSITEMFHDVIQYRQVNEYGKTLLQSSTLLNRRGWQNDGIVNQNRFVGFQIRLKSFTGLLMRIQEIGLQFTGPSETFNIYLFHSSKEDAIQTFEVTTAGNNGWLWKAQKLILNAFDSEEFHGGVFILGYYQEDVTSMAINYSNFDWNKGECGTCNSSHKNQWSAIQKYFHIFPLYVPNGDFVKGKMFDLEKAFFDKDTSYGLNLKLFVECDLTQFFIDNKMHFRNLLALKVVHKILYDMKFSQEINAIEENLKMMIIRDLEGDKETNYLNITQQYNREMKAINFNIGGLNAVCLPCQESATVPTVGVL